MAEFPDPTERYAVTVTGDPEHFEIREGPNWVRRVATFTRAGAVDWNALYMSRPARWQNAMLTVALKYVREVHSD